MSDLFDAFKQSSTLPLPARPPRDLRCVFVPPPGEPRLSFYSGDEEIDPPAARSYAGPWRDLLAVCEDIRRREELSLEWDNDRKRGFSLSRHPGLIPLAAATGSLNLPGGTPLEIREEQIAVRISGPGPYSARLVDAADRPLGFPQGIAESCILDGNILYQMPPMGPGFRSIRHLGTIIREEDLHRYLSLTRTHFPGLPLRFREYSIRSAGAVELSEGIIFSKMDRDGVLHLQFTLTWPGYPPDFFTAYDTAQVVEIDRQKECITFHPALIPDIRKGIASLRRRIQRLQKRHQDSDGFFVDDTKISLGPKLAEAFIEEELPGLFTRYLFFGTENLSHFRVTRSRPKLHLRLSGGADLLRGECDISVEGEWFTPGELMDLHREKGFIPLNSGGRALIDQKFLERLRRVLKEINHGEVTLSFFDLPLVQEIIDENLEGPGAVEPERIYRGFSELESRPVPVPRIQGTLREYQEHGYRWLYYLYRTGLNGCLADDMGLGKTVQTISLLSLVHADPGFPSLVVLPKSLIFNWQGEFARFAPQLQISTCYGPGRDWESAEESDIILTTYTVVRNDIQELRKRKFRYIILDEAQNIKNLSSRISRAMLLLESEHRLAISGTPMENNLMELYSLFRFLNPGMFGSPKEFQRDYANPIQKESCQVTAEDLRKKISPFLLRRLKTDVARDLPEKVEQVLYVEMEETQRGLYESRRDYFYRSIRERLERNGIEESQLYILQAISELRQIATVPESRSSGVITSPKREVMRESLEDVFAIHHKAIVFSNFLDSLENLGSDLEEMGISYLLLTGATRDRRGVVERFQSDDTSQALLMTLKTGGVGLNLTVADYVYLLDPWWNIAAENQAIDRSHRIGQRNTVFAYRLITKETIEERILELQQRKRELFNSVITAYSGIPKSLTRDDVEFILS
ncbi:DEAD/DEAH box helicase [Marispirochaeta aestuarii]|uniref:DEAD/DEAH box helicase n=1 Tax=Marispirochaeta aestuarii TaxID=1963862 RepID=UPI0029C89907|nr:DEAD/DEAH box helicase [Marispirochaeta aestuarii]